MDGAPFHNRRAEEQRSLHRHRPRHLDHGRANLRQDLRVFRERTVRKSAESWATVLTTSTSDLRSRMPEISTAMVCTTSPPEHPGTRPTDSTQAVPTSIVERAAF